VLQPSKVNGLSWADPTPGNSEHALFVGVNPEAAPATVERHPDLARPDFILFGHSSIRRDPESSGEKRIRLVATSAAHPARK
jgi:hypothetical protein